MSTENELELKIDAVITWVDGNDLNWQKKINKYLKVKKDFSKKNTKVFLEVRGKKHPANICGLPFYKKSDVKGANK